ncbi:MAG: L-lactate permease [Candidatus Accumulibacter sp.]|jgi:lactate permease|nr:L-lactate permease [Accumulibacter sp.]
MITSFDSFLRIACAALPIVWLCVSLCLLRLPGHVACPAGFGLAAVLALAVWRQGAAEVGSAALEGVLFALWPVLLIVFAAMLLFRYSEASGGMARIKAMLSGASPDRRVLALVFAWGFGGFLEGIAGFGTPVLIPCAILIALGFPPMTAVVCCLIANTTSTPFGQVGLPTLTLAGVTGFEAVRLSACIAMQTLVPTLLAPFLVVMVAGGGVRAVRGVFLIALAAALSFTLPWLAICLFVGPELPTLAGSVCTIAGTMAANRRLYRASGPNARYRLLPALAPSAPGGGITPGASAFDACLPFILVFIVVLLANSVPFVRDALAPLATAATIYTGAGAKPLVFSWVLTPGVLILAATVLSCLIQRRPLSLLARSAADTARGAWKMAVTVATLIAMAKVMSYGGMMDEIAAGLAAALGKFFPLAAPAIGTLGTFITGSNTSGAVLFGALQVKAAAAVGADPSWIVASNMSGGAVGKMISPQSIAVGLGAGGLNGREGDILRQTIKFSAAFAALVCLTTFFG